MIDAFLNTRDGERIYQLVTAFDFKIMPRQFFEMTRGEIELLLIIRERYMRELETEMNVRKR